MRKAAAHLARTEEIADILNGTTPAEHLAHARWIRNHEILGPILVSGSPPELITLEDLLKGKGPSK